MMRALRFSNGSSMIELLVVLVLMSSVSAMTYYAFTMEIWTGNRENANAAAQNRVRIAIERMVRELQTAGFDPADGNATVPDAFGFKEATAHRVRFSTDANRNGTWDQTAVNENRGFDLFAGSIRALAGAGTTTLASDVDDLAFTYLDGAGRPTTTLADIREIVIAATLVAQGRSPGMPASQHTLVGTAYMRNY